MSPARRISGIILLVLICAGLAVADPPERVARLSYLNGSVSVQPYGTEEWTAGVVNRPLTNSDNIWTDKDSRSELSVGTGFLRMNAETSLTLTNISDSTVQVQLHQGTLNLHTRNLYDGEIWEVDTPNVAFTIRKSGQYRFDVDSEGNTSVVTVWKGEGDATGNGSAIRIRGREQVSFEGANMAHQFHASPGYDGFDDWCRVRDERQDRSVSARYVAPGMVGYEDLDGYGNWQYVAPYGTIWVPSVAVGWSPYHFGRWVWVAPWGWTWVDDAPWGFAPFHYGRWVYYQSYWGWVPGPVSVRPVYAPALVAWYGGDHWGVSVGVGGGIGWFPLGWREPYYPHYTVSRGYFHQVNVSNTYITNITYETNNYFGGHRREPSYINARVNGGLTVVPNRVFTRGDPVYRSALHVSPDSIREARPLDRVPVDPSRESYHGGRVVDAPRTHGFSRPVVSRMPPPERVRDDARIGRTVDGARIGPDSRDTHQPHNADAIRRPEVNDREPRRINGDERIGNRVPRPDAGRADQPASGNVIRRDDNRDVRREPAEVRTDRVPRPDTNRMPDRRFPDQPSTGDVGRRDNNREARREPAEVRTDPVPRPDTNRMPDRRFPDQPSTGDIGRRDNNREVRRDPSDTQPNYRAPRPDLNRAPSASPANQPSENVMRRDAERERPAMRIPDARPSQPPPPPSTPPPPSSRPSNDAGGWRPSGGTQSPPQGGGGRGGVDSGPRHVDPGPAPGGGRPPNVDRPQRERPQNDASRGNSFRRQNRGE